MVDRDTLRILSGDGAFGFTTTAKLFITDIVQSVAAADINRDGRADVVTSHLVGAVGLNGTVRILLSRPGGDFYPPNLVTVTGAPNQVALADLDTDGDLDIAAVHGIRGDDVLLGGTGMTTSKAAGVTMSSTVTAETTTWTPLTAKSATTRRS